MSRWFRMYDELLDDPKAQRLPPVDFKEKFLAALQGEKNELSGFIKGPYSRPLSNEWAKIRAAVFERDGFTCRYCGAAGVRLECDHIIPVANGGGHDETNLATACRTCNRKKRARTLEELGWAL